MHSPFLFYDIIIHPPPPRVLSKRQRPFLPFFLLHKEIQAKTGKTMRTYRRNMASTYEKSQKKSNEFYEGSSQNPFFVIK